MSLSNTNETEAGSIIVDMGFDIPISIRKGYVRVSDVVFRKGRKMSKNDGDDATDVLEINLSRILQAVEDVNRARKGKQFLEKYGDVKIVIAETAVREIKAYIDGLKPVRAQSSNQGFVESTRLDFGDCVSRRQRLL